MTHPEPFDSQQVLSQGSLFLQFDCTLGDVLEDVVPGDATVGHRWVLDEEIRPHLCFRRWSVWSACELVVKTQTLEAVQQAVEGYVEVFYLDVDL